MDRYLTVVEDERNRRYYAFSVPVAIERIQREFSSHPERANVNLERPESRQTDDEGVREVANHRGGITRAIVHTAAAEGERYLLVWNDELLESRTDALTFERAK